MTCGFDEEKKGCVVGLCRALLSDRLFLCEEPTTRFSTSLMLPISCHVGFLFRCCWKQTIYFTRPVLFLFILGIQ